MVTNKSKKPELRFKGFSDDWEQRKWIDTVDISTEMVDPTSGEYDDLPHIAPGNIESFTGRILDNVKSVKEEQLISGKFRFKPGDVIYGKINPQLGKYFYACVDGLTSADAYVFNGKNGITQNFLFSLLQTEDFFKYSVSVSKRSGMPKINRDELNAYCFLAPDEEEQNIIGNFLLNIDNLITLHQSKCDKLKIIKKLMLNNLFPKNGEKNPKWRFNGFNDDWEQRKFSDITFTAGEKNRDNLPYESYSITNEDGFVPQDEKFENGGTMRDADKRMYIIVSPHSFAYNPARINVGSIGYQNTSKSVIVSSLYEVFKTTNDVNDRFLWHWFKSSDFQKMILRLQEGGVRLYFYYDKLCMGSIAMPSLHEQSLIGQYFDNLDCLITLHQSEVERLKKVKQFFLDKMFI